ncbi:MAG: threonine synthase [Thermomicrobiales bacterium]|nr:threonine synthase [Thermomicrobiales bacterium]
MDVRCMACGSTFSGTQPLTSCPNCGGLLDCVIPTNGVTRASLSVGASRRLMQSGVWKYRALLPAIPDDAVVTRFEGNTPIYFDDRIADYAGIASFGLKHEGENPTASFKDRGMTVGVSHAVSVGAQIVACASTGNTSASLASYAAAAKLAALVLIPEGKISSGKLSQTIAHGARVVQIEGDFDKALSLLRELTERYPVYLVNSVNPFRLEGQKTTVVEALDQLDWRVPDLIALPGGNLGNTSAFGKALIELTGAGLIDKTPQLVTVQAAGSAPFSAYYESGWEEYEPVHAETIATAIKIGNPASVPRAKRAIEFTSGFVPNVTDEEIMDAKAVIDRVGIGCEPASAATLAGVRKLRQQGMLSADATAIGILTGHVLKDGDATVKYHFEGDGPMANKPVSIPGTLADLERVLSDALHG